MGSLFGAFSHRKISRWEYGHVVEAVQRRLDEHPAKMRQRRETAEHPFGALKDEDGRNSLSDEAPAERRHRNGTACVRLQSDSRNEHHGHPERFDTTKTHHRHARLRIPV